MLAGLLDIWRVFPVLGGYAGLWKFRNRVGARLFCERMMTGSARSEIHPTLRPNHRKPLTMVVVADTRQPRKSVCKDNAPLFLLLSGMKVLVAGAIAAGMVFAMFGGVSADGPRGVSGWFSLVAAMMCMPFGLLRCLQGVLGWLRYRS